MYKLTFAEVLGNGLAGLGNQKEGVMKTVKQVSSSEVDVAGGDAKVREIASGIVRDNLGKALIVVGVGDMTVVLLRDDYAAFLVESDADILGAVPRTSYGALMAESVLAVPNGYIVLTFCNWRALAGEFDMVIDAIRNLPKMPEPVKVVVHSFE